MITSSRPRILVVDDDPSILHALSRVLGPHYQVATAAGPLAALELAPAFRPDVAVIDIRMPEMNGFELMQRLRDIAVDVDVILMTGNAEEPDANLVRAIDSGAFYFIQKPFERRVLLALTGRCVELRQLREEKQLHMQQLEEDLRAAQQFQMSLLPPSTLELAGLSICAKHIACHALAGDFYDYVNLDDKTAALVIADVVGHGTAAAMMTGLVKAAFHAAGPDGFRPLSVVNRVKEAIRAFDPGRFITLCCARVELGAGRVVYANAGHPPMILHGPRSSPVILDSTGPLVSSALAEVPCLEETVKLRPDDCLLFYTDGVIEAAGPGSMFGQERMLSLLGQRECQAGQLVDRILDAVTEFSAGRRMQDDMTLMAAHLLA